MPQVIPEPTYTCDVCGIAIPAHAVISYRVSCAMTGNNLPSFDVEQIYACTPDHAVQAAQAQLIRVEAQRAAGDSPA